MVQRLSLTIVRVATDTRAADRVTEHRQDKGRGAAVGSDE